MIDAFDACVDRLNAGRSVDDCLRAYPHYARELRPMLEAVVLARSIPPAVAEANAARSRVDERFEAQLATMQAGGGGGWGIPAWLAAAASLILVAAIILLSQRAIPGDPLYAVKRWSEDAAVFIIPDDSGIDRTIQQRRRDEVADLLDAGRTETVVFTGTVEAMNDEGAVLIDGLAVLIDPLLVTVAPGDEVEVDARTTDDGRIIAIRVRVLLRPDQSGPVIAPPPIETDVPSRPTATPSATHTPTSTPSATRTLTTTPSATRTPSPTATRTATVRPTLTPTACVPNPPQDWMRYTIQPGDRLVDIAQRTGTTVDRLVTVNCLRDANAIVIGQSIFIPPPGESPEPPPDQPTARPPTPVPAPTEDRPGGRP
jgi:LysM repeat protein/AcrR family transcriptional regulator